MGELEETNKVEESTSVSIREQSEEGQQTLKILGVRTKKLESDLQKILKENQKQKDKIYNLQHLLQRKNQHYILQNRENKALKERQEKYHRELYKLRKTKLNPEQKDEKIEINNEENSNQKRNQEYSIKTIKQLQNKTVELEHQLSYVKNLNKAASNKNKVDEKEILKKNLDLVQENLALKYQLQKVQRDLEDQRQKFDEECSKSQKTIEQLNETILNSKIGNCSEMFLMSRELTEVLNSQKANEHNEGFFLSETNAKIFKSLDTWCSRLPVSKKLSFLGALNTFSELNIEKIVETQETTIDDLCQDEIESDNDLCL